jgi:hypothetical protein
MRLSDPAASRAVLIGVHTYAEQPDLPAVEHNLDDLRDALTDPEIWGLPAGHCRVVAQPKNHRAVLNAVIAAGQQATDTLVVYYAGHGLIDLHTDDLYLTLPDTDPEFTATALAYEHLRRAIRDPRIRAPRKVVILDCCYSGRALEGGMGAAVATRTVTDGTHVLTASAATQRAWSPPGERHTAFTGELVRVLEEGIPGGAGLLTTDAIYQHVHLELRAKGRPLPQQQNRNAGGDIVIARNCAVSGTPRPPRRRPPPERRDFRTWLRDSWSSWGPAAKLVLVAAITLAVILAIAVFIAWNRNRGGSARAGLENCHVVEAAPGVSKAYSCDQGTVEVYPDSKTLDPGYARIVADSDVPESTGDCAAQEDGEHRYPVTGPAKGRVLCYTTDDVTTVLWTDDKAHTITRVEAPVADLRTLRDSWASSHAPTLPFPTTDEKALIDLPVAAGCARAGIEEMDDFPGTLAGVTCDETGGAGAQSVSYFKFDSVPKLRETMASHIPADRDPAAHGCQDGKAPKFTDGRPYDIRGVLLGTLLCRPAVDGNLVMEWSVEALGLAARATGNDAAALARWWREDRGPPFEKVVTAVNARRPVFPETAAEKALLALIPPNSRLLCMRPSGEFKNEHVPNYRSTAAVVCGPRTGPKIAFYYQFASKTDMLDSYGILGDPKGRCTDSPTAVTGESAYSRGGARGRLRCFNQNGPARMWTDERRLVLAFAFQGRGAEAMSDWWEHDAGPL